MSVNIQSGTLKSSSITKDKPLILIHGGAGPADPKSEKALEAKAAMEHIAATLRTGLIDPAICERVKNTHLRHQVESQESQATFLSLWGAYLLENDPRFNAGYGAALQKDGTPRLSASFMESKRQKFSAITNIPETRHPSHLAFELQFERFCMLDTIGAQNLARDLRLPRENLITQERFARWVTLKQEELTKNNNAADRTGTIGCVVVDSELNLAATTSTGGVGNETIGRIGDTPTVAGNYCTKEVAISATGIGEEIVNSALAARIATRVADGCSLVEATDKTFREARERNYQFSAICVGVSPKTQLVEWVAASTTQYFAWCKLTPNIGHGNGLEENLT